MGLPGTECDNLVRGMAPFLSSLLSIYSFNQNYMAMIETHELIYAVRD